MNRHPAGYYRFYGFAYYSRACCGMVAAGFGR